MSHSPLHQTLHLRLAMRKDYSLSLPALSPSPVPPPGSTASQVQKERDRVALSAPPALSAIAAPPALPAPSRPLPPTPLAPATDSPRAREAPGMMRATHIRPRTAPTSPERPGAAFSTRSTIRKVAPSPESLSDAFASGVADEGAPAPGPAFEPFPRFDAGQGEKTAKGELHTHSPSAGPSGGGGGGGGGSGGGEAAGLRRGGTPSGRASPCRSGTSSPQKSRSRSPRKNLVRTPTLPAQRESPSTSSVYSGAEEPRDEHLEPPDTPTPVPRSQKREAYVPLQIRRARAAQKASESAKPEGYATHVRIADYMRKMKAQRRSRSVSPEKEVQEAAPSSAAAPLTMHIVQAMAQPQPQPQPQPQAPSKPQSPSRTLSPSSAPQKRAGKEAVRDTSISRCSEASGASVASKHSIFSTPGRDEMERKKPIVEEDEGPFAEATNVRDLEQRRRRVSVVEKQHGDEEERKGVCGLRCVVM